MTLEKQKSPDKNVYMSWSVQQLLDESVSFSTMPPRPETTKNQQVKEADNFENKLLVMSGLTSPGAEISPEKARTPSLTPQPEQLTKLVFDKIETQRTIN